MKKMIAVLFICGVAAAANAQKVSPTNIEKADKSIAVLAQDSTENKAAKDQFQAKARNAAVAVVPAVTDKAVSDTFSYEDVERLSAQTDEEIKACGNDKLIAAVFKYKESIKYCKTLNLKANIFWNAGDPHSCRCVDGKTNLEVSNEQMPPYKFQSGYLGVNLDQASYCDSLKLKVNKYWNTSDPHSCPCEDGKSNLEIFDEQNAGK
ncbi:MAG: hypothetical protein FWF35_05800 [Elusimicrobia bacterium]|nr:hypothetical protein [Elusimicrobiota bacterium]